MTATLEDADFNLVDLLFGLTYHENVKTTHIEPYRNPLDVRLALLANCLNDTQIIDMR